MASTPPAAVSRGPHPWLEIFLVGWAAKVLRMTSTVRKPRTVALALLLCSTLLAGCGSSKSANPNLSSTTTAISAPTTSTTEPGKVEFTSFTSAGCPSSSVGSVSSSQEIMQSMSGAVSACIRMGALTPGKYFVSIQGISLLRGTAAAHRGLPVPSGSQAGPAVSLQLSPRSGSPGSVIHFVGTAASAPIKRNDHIQICWNGCETGLQYSGVPVTWTSSTTFKGSFVAPAAPWFEANSDKIAPLESGDYKVSVECLSSAVKGCALGAGEGSASYHLQVPSGGASWCPNTSGCATLKASNTDVFPGDVVKIHGYAPLMQIIGSKQPYQFQLKVASGPSPTSEVRFSSNQKGAVDISMGHATITVGTPPSFSSLGAVTPAQTTSAGAGPISRNPANPQQIVWCGGGKIELVGSKGSESISTASLASDLKSHKFGLMGGSTPRCSSVALSSGGASTTIFASFTVAPNFQAPPVASVALETSDGGKSWTFLPVPSGAKASTFAGFRYSGSSVEALFAPSSSPSSYFGKGQSVPLVETFNEESSSWGAGSFQCSSNGPCVTFGSYLPGNCAMNGSQQSIFYSSDGGKSWLQPLWPASVQSCWPAELVAISSHKELLISTGSQYLVRESLDGGAQWKVIGIPIIPGSKQVNGFAGSVGAKIQMLADGSLLVSGQRDSINNWQLLNPGSKSWCEVQNLPSGVLSSSKFSPLYQLGSTLYWVTTPTGNNSGSPALQSIAESRVKC